MTDIDKIPVASGATSNSIPAAVRSQGSPCTIGTLSMSIPARASAAA